MKIKDQKWQVIGLLAYCNGSRPLSMNEATQVIHAIEQGDVQASEKGLPT